MDALIGVVVGAVLAALFGAWRDRQQRDHEQRAELRTERISATADLLATSDRMWRATQNADHWAEQALHFGKAHDRDNEQVARTQHALVMPEKVEAVRQGSGALGRVRLLCPQLGPTATALFEASKTYSYREAEEHSAAHADALNAFEEAAQRLLGIAVDRPARPRMRPEDVVLEHNARHASLRQVSLDG